MKPAALMWLGAMGAVLAIAGEIAGAQVAVTAVAAGALFGKGYGVWEERSRRTPSPEAKP